MIRTRLTLWNCIVLSLVLTVTALAIYFTTRETLFSNLDRSLITRAEYAAKTFLNQHWPGGPGGPPPGDRGKEFEKDSRRGPPPDPFAQMDVNAAREAGIDPHQLNQLRAESTTFRPRFIWVDRTGGRGGPDKPWDPDGFVAAKRGETTLKTMDISDFPFRVITVPIYQDKKVVAAAQFTAPLESANEDLARLAKTLAFVCPLGIAVMLVTGVMLTRRALRPVMEIASAAEQIEATNLAGRLPVYGQDEFAHLSKTFNTMLGRLETTFNEKDEAYAKQRQFTADASHELKTPLTAIKVRTGSALRKELEPGKYREHLRAIDRAANVMTAIVQDLLFLARSDDGRLELNREPVEVAELIEEAIASVTTVPDRIHAVVSTREVIPVDRLAFTRVLVNLLNNSMQHTTAGKRIEVRASSEGATHTITVADQGEGIPADDVPLVFNRFHRVDRSRDRESGGSGLGLAIAKAIVEAHHGEICLTSAVGKGTAVTIRLPR